MHDQLASAAHGEAAALFSVYLELKAGGRWATWGAAIDRTAFLYAAADLGHVEALEIIARSSEGNPMLEPREELLASHRELAIECWRKLAELGVPQYRLKVLELELYCRIPTRSEPAKDELRLLAQTGSCEAARLLAAWYSSVENYQQCYVWERVYSALGGKGERDTQRLAEAMSRRTMPHGHWQSGWVDKDILASARAEAERIIATIKKG